MSIEFNEQILQFHIDRHFKGYEFDMNMINKICSTFQSKKGVMLAGGIGSGKTTIFRLLERCMAGTEYNFDIVNALSIMKTYSTKGLDGLNKWTENALVNNYGVEIRQPRIICIDDFGIESEVEYYGNAINPVEYVLMARYDLFQTCGLKTYLTTNLDIQHMKDKYSNRLISRMREMFIYIELNTRDRRK